MANVLGIVFANMNEENLDMLTKIRATGSVPFGGRYRLIDFVLSSMVNSGINKVGVVTSNNYQSLMDHLESGKEWDLARKNGGLFLLPPFGSSEDATATRLGALKNIERFIERSTEDYVVLSDCDVIYNIDYNKLIEAHEKNNAEITMMYHRGAHDVHASRKLAILDIGEDGVVSDMSLDTAGVGEVNQYIKVMIMNRTQLQAIIANAVSHGNGSILSEMQANVLKYGKTYAVEYTGFYSYVNSVQTYFKASMEVLKREKRDALFNVENQEIYTKVRDSAPTKYGADCSVANSFIADGCVIEGTVENSVIFRGAKVLKGAVVKNSIVMQDGYIGKGANLSYVVCDKNVSIKDDRVLAGCEELPYFIGKNQTL